MRRIASLLVLATLVVTGACERRRDAGVREQAARALSGILAYPQSSVVSVSAGEDAAEVVLETPASLDRVVTWYREALPLNGWEFQSDLTNRDGSVTMSAQKGKRPLWATFRGNVGAPGTTYTLVGVFVTDGDSLRVKDSLK